MKHTNILASSALQEAGGEEGWSPGTLAGVPSASHRRGVGAAADYLARAGSGAFLPRFLIPVSAPHHRLP